MQRGWHSENRVGWPRRPVSAGENVGSVNNAPAIIVIEIASGNTSGKLVHSTQVFPFMG